MMSKSVRQRLAEMMQLRQKLRGFGLEAFLGEEFTNACDAFVRDGEEARGTFFIPEANRTLNYDLRLEIGKESNVTLKIM